MLISNISTKRISRYSIFYIFVIILAHTVFFNIHVNFLWVSIGALLAIWFLYFLPNYENKFYSLPRKKFLTKIFWSGFYIRLFFLILIQLETVFSTGQTDYVQYVGAVDALGYEYYAKLIVKELYSGNYEVLKLLYYDIAKGSFDDTGFYSILALLHFFAFNSSLLVKMLLIAINSYISVQLYYLSSFYFNEKTSRLAAVLALLFPLSFFYAAVYLKTSLIVFLSLSGIIATIRLINGPFNIKKSFQLIVVIFLLFTLRAPVAIVLILTVITGVFTNFSSLINKRLLSSIFVIMTIIFALIIVNQFASDTYIINKILSGDDIAIAKMAHVSKQISLTNLAGVPLFISLTLFAPFPNLIMVPNNLTLDHVPDDYLIGGLLVWSIMAAFAMLGLFRVIYYQFRRTILLWFFPVLYLIMLANLGYFTSERMQYTSMPILLIFSAVGINDKQTIKYRVPLITISGILIFFWNYFRLQSRGLI